MTMMSVNNFINHLFTKRNLSCISTFCCATCRPQNFQITLSEIKVSSLIFSFYKVEIQKLIRALKSMAHSFIGIEDSICARGGIKIPLIEAYNSIHHLDLFAVSESILRNDIKMRIFLQMVSAKIYIEMVIRVILKQGVSVFIFEKTYKSKEAGSPIVTGNGDGRVQSSSQKGLFWSFLQP